MQIVFFVFVQGFHIQSPMNVHIGSESALTEVFELYKIFFFLLSCSFAHARFLSVLVAPFASFVIAPFWDHHLQTVNQQEAMRQFVDPEQFVLEPWVFCRKRSIFAV